jgi:hypothetical protein
MRKNAIRLAGTAAAMTGAALLAAAPASAVDGFHTTFTLTGVHNSISGYVLDGHMPGTKIFEKEVWFFSGADANSQYQSIITIGGCHNAPKVPEPLPTAALGTLIKTNKNGDGRTSFVVTQASLAGYLQYVGIDPSTLPAKIPAQLLLVKPFGKNSKVWTTAPLLKTSTAENRVLAKTDCRMVATRR